MSYELRIPGSTSWMSGIRDLRTARRELIRARRYTDFGRDMKIYRVMRNGERVECGLMEGE